MKLKDFQDPDLFSRTFKASKMRETIKDFEEPVGTTNRPQLLLALSGPKWVHKW